MKQSSFPGKLLGIFFLGLAWCFPYNMAFSDPPPVVAAGESKLNPWVNEERNIYEDYLRAFDEEPPMISGVAILTDTDNTGESATAYYGDILFKRAR